MEFTIVQPRKGKSSKLSWLEDSYGFWIGGRRRLNALQRKCKELRGCDQATPAEQLYFNIRGALGEIGVAKLLNRYWFAGINDAKGRPDVAPDIQVRTVSIPTYCLKIHSDDPPMHRYVLAVEEPRIEGEPQEIWVVGWIWGHEAMDMEEYFGDKAGRNQPAYWIPQEPLYPIEDLIIE